jgi:hypothetical protein
MALACPPAKVLPPYDFDRVIRTTASFLVITAREHIEGFTCLEHGER